VKLTILTFVCVLAGGTPVVSATPQQTGEDHELKRVASEIAAARITRALNQYWNDRDGFSLPPMKVDDAVSEHDTERIKTLVEENPTIWKSIDPVFADRYRQLQAAVNDRHLENAGSMRRLIMEGINDAVGARGGGSTSGMLRVFGSAETEWILRQLYSAAPPSTSKTQFASELQSKIFYFDSTGDSDAQASFKRALNKFRQAEAMMKDAQQAVFRSEVLAYFD
jgi:hypothetical protein